MGLSIYSPFIVKNSAFQTQFRAYLFSCVVVSYIVIQLRDIFLVFNFISQLNFITLSSLSICFYLHALTSVLEVYRIED